MGIGMLNYNMCISPSKKMQLKKVIVKNMERGFYIYNKKNSILGILY